MDDYDGELWTLVFVKIIKKHTQEIVIILLSSTQDRGVTLGLRY